MTKHSKVHRDRTGTDRTSTDHIGTDRTNAARTRATRTGMALACALLVTTGCASLTPVPPEPEVLTASTAGATYLDAVCPVNEAWDEADVVIDSLRVVVSGDASGGEVDVDQARADYVAALESVGAASTEAAAALSPEDRVWPDGAAATVEKIHASLLADAEEIEGAAELSAKEAADYIWDVGDIAVVSAEARAALDLPEDPEFACAAWQKQAAPDAEAAEEGTS